MKISRKFPLSVGGLIAGLAVLTSTGLARAEEPFPGALQEAAGLECAPSCLVCHTTNPGDISSWPKKPFGLFMGTNGLNKTTGEAGVKAAFEKYKADPKQAAGLARLMAGLDPDTGSELCQMTYGCGAHIAKDAPRDDWSGLLFVAGAMGFGALLRRTKRR